VSGRGYRAITQLAAGVAVGLVLGFIAGWWLWPVQYTNTAPSMLRQDYHDDYIVMIAGAYEVDRDLEQARERLSLLSPGEPAAPVVELAERIIEAGGSPEDINRLAYLAAAFEPPTPALAPYLE
jgi:hypothetical protein